MKTVEEQLKEIILEKYSSIRKFIEKIDMPYSTMNTILKRGVKNANIINIIKICNELDISTDKLANGIIERKKVGYETLSANEEILISNFNKLNDLGKNEANKRVKELTEINRYTRNGNEDYLMPVACHNDNLTEDEKTEMNRRIEEILKKRNK